MAGRDEELAASVRMVWEAVDQERMRQMLEHLPSYAVMVDTDLRYQWVNRLDPTLHPDQVIGRHASEFVNAADFPTVEAAVERALQTGENQRYEIRGYSEGSLQAWYETVVVPLPAKRPQDTRVLLLSNDISKRYAAQKALADSEARFRRLTESSPDLIGIVDAQQRVVYVNRDPDAEHGVMREAVLGCTLRDLSYPDDADSVAQHVAHTLRTGEPTRYEARSTTGDQHFNVRVLRLTGVGQDAQALVTVTDVTDRKRAEAQREALELQLQRAQRLDTVGRLAGGVAHDFNNLLLVIQSHLEFANTALAAGEDASADLAAIAKAAEQAGQMTRRLLTIGRRQPPEQRSVDLVQLVGESLRLLDRVMPESVAFHFDAPMGQLVVNVDPAQLEQVVMNLCLNARDAIEGTGRITVAIAREAGKAVLSVADTGVGMSEAVMARAFEPFFTTKGLGKGTGLGLSVVHSIVVQNGGEIELHSVEGQGTTFRIRFAELGDGVSEVTPQPPVAAPGASPVKTVLLAEDEPSVRRIVTRILSGAGIRVLVACDGQEAVELFEKHADEVDLTLLDAMMPNLGGRDAYEQIQKLRPGTKALFCSGYSAEALPRAFLQAHGLTVLPKPYRPADLLEAVRRLLDA